MGLINVIYEFMYFSPQSFNAVILVSFMHEWIWVIFIWFKFNYIIMRHLSSTWDMKTFNYQFNLIIQFEPNVYFTFIYTDKFIQWQFLDSQGKCSCQIGFKSKTNMEFKIHKWFVGKLMGASIQIFPIKNLFNNFVVCLSNIVSEWFMWHFIA